jgi:hypothetical protein
MPLAGFETAIPACERVQTHSLHGACVQWDRANNYTHIEKYEDSWEWSETDVAAFRAAFCIYNERLRKVFSGFHGCEFPPTK